MAIVVKNPPANVRDAGSKSGSGNSPGGGHSSPPQCSCLESPMDRGAWQATVHGVTQSQTWLKRLSTHTHTTYILRLPGVRMQTSYKRILYEKFIFYHRKMKKAVLRSPNSSFLHHELLTCGRSACTKNHSLISPSLKQQLLNVRLELMQRGGLMPSCGRDSRAFQALFLKFG